MCRFQSLIMVESTEDNEESTEDSKDIVAAESEKPALDVVIEERADMPYALTPFDRSVDMKIWNRRWKVYWLWLEADLTQEEIGKIVGVERWTIIQDLKAMRKFLRFVPERLENTIQEIYMRMVMTRNEIQGDARRAEKPSDKAKLWNVVATIDNKILERFTQRTLGKTGQADDARLEAPNLGQYALEYLGETYGPEAVEHCLEWMDKRVRFQSTLTKNM